MLRIIVLLWNIVMDFNMLYICSVVVELRLEVGSLRISIVGLWIMFILMEMCCCFFFEIFWMFLFLICDVVMWVNLSLVINVFICVSFFVMGIIDGNCSCVE